MRARSEHVSLRRVRAPGTSELAAMKHVTSQTIRNALRDLLDSGRVVASAPGTSPRIKYRLCERTEVDQTRKTATT